MKQGRPFSVHVCVAMIALMLGVSWGAWMVVQAADSASDVNHYVTEDGTGGFVLDLSGDDPLMRTDGSTEIAVLVSVPGPRGDTIYKYASGRTVLRQTNIGGITLFDRFYPEGRPVVRDSTAQPLVLIPLPLKAVQARATLLAGNLSNRVGTKLKIDVNWDAVPGGDSGAAALEDVMQVVAIGLRRISIDTMGKDAIADKIKTLRFMAADTINISLEKGILTVSYQWEKGVKGRPSSSDVVAYLNDVL